MLGMRMMSEFNHSDLVFSSQAVFGGRVFCMVLAAFPWGISRIKWANMGSYGVFPTSFLSI